MNENLNRNSTARWRHLDVRHHLNPFSDYRTLKARDGGSRIIVRGEGSYLYDSDGQQILDGMAGLWCVNVGYGREELARRAYEQMLELPYYNSFFKTTTPPTVELAEKLAELAPGDLNYVFYGSSGSESNDTVVRMTRFYWHKAGKPEKRNFISRTHAYHGSTMASASLGGMKPMQEVYGLPLEGFHHVMPPYWYDFGGDLSLEAFGLQAARAIEEKILELGPETVGAFIGEPIMGAGGVLIPPESYWPEVQRICRKYDVLLVADEVICGFGRTGEMFGSQLYGIEPDMMTLAKGITSGYLPLSAVMVNERIAAKLREEGGEFAHGYTYSGHPVPCAVALANIALLEDEDLVRRAREVTGPHLRARLNELVDHPLVGEVRSEGLIAAVELVRDKQARSRWDDKFTAGQSCRDHCIANNIVLRAVRDSMVLSPPLTIETDQIDKLVDGLRVSLDRTAEDMARG